MVKIFALSLGEGLGKHFLLLFERFFHHFVTPFLAFQLGFFELELLLEILILKFDHLQRSLVIL